MPGIRFGARRGVLLKGTGVPGPTYTVTPAAGSINEGSALTINIGGSNIVDGTYYWTVTNSGDFSVSSGSFSITSNAGSFTVTPTADSSTEGSETFTVSIRSGSTSGTILATSSSITINDTSTTVFKILLTTTDTNGWNSNIKPGILTAAALYPGLTLSITEVYGPTSIPTVTVGQYDAIFFWSNASVPWNASLDTHNSNNGGLVTAQFYGSTGISGITAALMPTVSGSGGQGAGSLAWPSPPYSHAIANGSDGSTQRVTSFASASFGASSPSLNSGASTVVTSTSGPPLVVVKDNTAPTGRTVFLNFFPPDGSSIGWNSTTYPQGFLLMLNALLWSARKI